MKKVLSIALVVTMLLSCVAAAVPVSAATSGNYTYSVNDDGTTATVTKYNGTETNVVIPSVIDGYTITSIGNWAFRDCTSLVSVTIPEGVTSIGSGAFKYCTSLASVTIPDSVTSIGSSAFYGCSSLASVTIPEGVTSIGEGAFYNCTSLTSVTIPASVTSIGRSAFYGCSNLEGVYITDIAAWCNISFDNNDPYYSNPLYYAKKLYINGELATDIEIPEGVTSIGDYAFRSCTSLASVTITEGVTSIGEGAFSGCTSLTSITIPEGVTSIGERAFYYCTSLASVTIPDGVVRIGNSAFGGCSSLASITISDSVTSIGSCAFFATAYEYNIANWENDVLFIDNHLISANNRYISGSYNVPEGTKTISDSAFSDCTRLVSISIPEGVTSIGYMAFYDCTSLASVTIPSSVTSIGEDAFYNCTSLEGVYITDLAAWCNISFAETYHSNPLFYANKLYINGELATDIVIPEGVTSIGGFAFEDCASLTSVTIPDSVTSIGDRAFAYCTSLASVTIPSSVTRIGKDAFYNCTSLEGVYITDLAAWCNISFSTSYSNPLCNAKKLYINGDLATDIVIPEGVTSIGDNAFRNCTSLASVTIPASVTSISDYAFYNCTSLEGVYITDIAAWCNISFSSSSSNPLCNAKKLYINGELATDIVIPEGVTSIGDCAFCDCTNLASVTIPEGVTNIGDSAFCWCTSLASITIPEGVTSIGEGAFSGCTSLTSITIPEGVTSIGESAFYYCTSLEGVYITDLAAWCNISFYSHDSNPLYYAKKLYINGELATDIVIPEGVTSIGNYAFSGCRSFASVTIPEGVTSIGSDAFYNCRSLEGVYITNLAAWCNISFNSYDSNPLSYAKYLYINGELATDIVIPEGVTNIGEAAFYECTSLASVTIPASVTSIGRSAFSGCTSLASVTIPEGVTSIGSSAFHGCSSLASVTIPEGVTSIEWGAFYGCTSLTSVTIPEGVKSIGDYAFDNCTSLTSVTIPEGVKSIGDHAFSGCRSFASVTIPEGVTSIGWYAFWGCSSLASVTIPESVTWIGYNAFEYCISLTSVTIPESVTSIDYSAFEKCTSLKSINVDINNEYYSSEDGVLFNKDKTNLIQYPIGNTRNNYNIPEGVTSIGDYAFEDCTSLASVTITEGVTSIGEGAFSGCTSLTSITIPEGVTSIGERAFYYCTSLASVTIPKTVTSIGNYAFSGCGLKHVLYAGTEEEWNLIVFGSSNDSLTNAVRHYSCGSEVISSVVVVAPTCIEPGYTKYLCTVCDGEYNSDYTDALGHNFVNGSCSSCGMLEEDCIESEHNYANNCDETWTIYKPEAKWMAITFNTSTKTGSGDYIYIYGAEDNQIGRYSGTALAGKRIVVKSDTVKIRLTSDSSGVYYGFALSNVEVYYEDCRHSNTEIRDAIEATCVTAGSTGAVYCFDCDEIVTEATVIPALGHKYENGYCTVCGKIEGLIFTVYNNKIAITGYGESPTELIIPRLIDGCYVTQISSNAFKNCTTLKKITLPDTLTSIGSSAFYDCTSLTSVTIPDGLMSIGDYAFRGCTSLESVTIPASVKTIGDLAFTNCTSLESVTILEGEGVTSIGEMAFYNCTSLKSVTIPASVKRIASSAFSECDNLVIYGYSGTKAETYAFNNGITFIPFTDLTDSESNVAVSGAVPAETQLKVDIITTTDTRVTYDITLTKNGEEIQPGGTVTVKIPVPAGMDGADCRVYREEESGSYTDMNAVYKDGFMVFTTEHFSKYVITSEMLGVVLGDINGDGVVTLKDVLVARKYVAGVASLTDEEIYRGDINGDGVLTLKDVLTMRKMVAGVL